MKKILIGFKEMLKDWLFKKYIKRILNDRIEEIKKIIPIDNPLSYLPEPTLINNEEYIIQELKASFIIRETDLRGFATMESESREMLSDAKSEIMKLAKEQIEVFIEKESRDTEFRLRLFVGVKNKKK